MSDLQEQFGEIDIYVFDQLLRQRLHPAMRVLDVGCGSGRNLVYLLQSGCEVFGIDPDPISIQVVQRLASRLAPRLPPDNFRVESIEQTSFPEAFADAARQALKLGYTALKFDPFGSGWRTLSRREEDLSIQIVAAVRAAVGPEIDLAVEAHSRFSVSNAIRIGKRLEPYSPAWFEEPVPHGNIQAIIEVARHLEVPIATGERLATRCILQACYLDQQER